jgi:NAD(P)-dependent dehydrogenase (short-subunit alcohol dehydrogenase family)
MEQRLRPVADRVPKAPVVKLTENLAWEARRHGISLFSVHPGLLPIGLTEAALSGAAACSPAEAAISEWTRGELAAGRGTDPARAVELIVRLLRGPYAALSGRTSRFRTTSTSCSNGSTRSGRASCISSGCDSSPPDASRDGRVGGRFV